MSVNEVLYTKHPVYHMNELRNQDVKKKIDMKKSRKKTLGYRVGTQTDTKTIVDVV